MRRLLIAFSYFCAAASLHAQSPARQTSPSKPAPAPPTTASPAAPTAAPSPSPSVDSLINSMSATDLQQAVQLLKSNYINPDSLNELELNRAMVTGLLERLGGAAVLVAEKPADASEATNPFFGEMLEGRVAYLRPGALTTANLQAMDASLQSFSGKKPDAVVLDLRSSPATDDFAVAAEFGKRFCSKGKVLFSLRKGPSKQERAFSVDRDPAFQGLMILLVDGDTAGPAEALAGALRLHNKALLIGEPTAGRAYEISDLPLNSGKVLRVAVAEAFLPENGPLLAKGLLPDVAVEMSEAEKRLVFQQSMQGGMGPFIFETGRPHLNEAALLAGRNLEIEALESAQRRARR